MRSRITLPSAWLFPRRQATMLEPMIAKSSLSHPYTGITSVRSPLPNASRPRPTVVPLDSLRFRYVPLTGKIHDAPIKGDRADEKQLPLRIGPSKGNRPAGPAQETRPLAKDGVSGEAYSRDASKDSHQWWSEGMDSRPTYPPRHILKSDCLPSNVSWTGPRLYSPAR